MDPYSHSVALYRAMQDFVSASNKVARIEGQIKQIDRFEALDPQTTQHMGVFTSMGGMLLAVVGADYVARWFDFASQGFFILFLMLLVPACFLLLSVFTHLHGDIRRGFDRRMELEAELEGAITQAEVSDSAYLKTAGLRTVEHKPYDDSDVSA